MTEHEWQQNHGGHPIRPPASRDRQSPPEAPGPAVEEPEGDEQPQPQYALGREGEEYVRKLRSSGPFDEAARFMNLSSKAAGSARA